MPRYKIVIEYDGTPFIGWQRQKNGLSVQQVLEEAAQHLTRTPTPMTGAGRTDCGVHALGAVAHFDTQKSYEDFTLVNALNYYLHGQAVKVLSAQQVEDDFSARFSAKKRHYLYRILNRRAPSALNEKRVWHIPPPLDLRAMITAAPVLLGKHDFSSFRSIECQAKSPVRTLDTLDLERIGEEIHLHISARSFLHNQVRIITGTLYNVGMGKWTKNDVARVLDAKNRTVAGPTAPAYGLYLEKVEY